MATLKLIHEVDTSGPAFELNRYNNLILAFDGDRSMLEIDIKHQLLIRNSLKYPPKSVRCCPWEGSNQYFITNLNKIQKKDGGVISESNSKSQFTGLIDTLGQGMLFSKYHKNYQKHSINFLWEGNKKIVKLSDHIFTKLIFNPCNNQIIYSIKDIVNCFDLNEPQKDTILLKKSTFIHDRNNLYYLTLSLETKSKQEYECGIFDFRNGKNTNTWISKDIPIKAESFANSLTVATSNALQIYDIRKLIKPFIRQPVKGIKDFLYEPNVNKIFIGCQSKLRVFQTQY